MPACTGPVVWLWPHQVLCERGAAGKEEGNCPSPGSWPSGPKLWPPVK